MRMRNPWGQTEYSGFASESDTKFWGQVPKETKDKILPKREADDGDFVLPFSEFIRNFDSIDICHVHDDYCF
jgi:calpain-15